MPVRLPSDEMLELDRVVVNRRRVKKGSSLFHTGDLFKDLYAIRVGNFKTVVSTPEGQEQVTGFQMAGELLGLDGIVNDQYMCSAVALDDAEVCVLPYEDIADLSSRIKTLRSHLHKILSREIVRDQSIILMLGSMSAEERIAAFLLNLAKRLKARGQSEQEFLLRMGREDIGSYLGLKIETVSRTLTKLSGEGILEVSLRSIKIVDENRLKAMVPTEWNA
jgi:CRP/FNR family transcriptional regulator, anaerobic regulatory protein